MGAEVAILAAVIAGSTYYQGEEAKKSQARQLSAQKKLQEQQLAKAVSQERRNAMEQQRLKPQKAVKPIDYVAQNTSTNSALLTNPGALLSRSLGSSNTFLGGS